MTGILPSLTTVSLLLLTLHAMTSNVQCWQMTPPNSKKSMGHMGNMNSIVTENSTLREMKSFHVKRSGHSCIFSLQHTSTFPTYFNLSNIFQPFQNISTFFNFFPTNSNIFQNSPTYFNLSNIFQPFQHISTFFNFFPTNSNIFQNSPTYSSLSNISQHAVIIILLRFHCSCMCIEKYMI